MPQENKPFELTSVEDFGPDTYGTKITFAVSLEIGQNDLTLEQAIKATLATQKTLSRIMDNHRVSLQKDSLVTEDILSISIDDIQLTDEEKEAILSGNFTVKRSPDYKKDV